MYETITSPISYGGLTLKNRVIFAPTSMGLRGEELTARLGRIAAGGCAMIVIGDVPVLPQRFVPSLYTEKGRAFYRALADAVHREGCLLCAQLHQSDANVKAMGKYLPGVLTGRISKEDLRPLLNRQVGPYITGLSQRKIREITEGFGTAAELALQVGFDMVQVHGDRMCGSFSSSVFNHRTDCYGGSAENRARCGGGGVRHPLPPAGPPHRLQAGGAPGESPLWKRRSAGGGAARLRTSAGGGGGHQLSCDPGKPWGPHRHHSPQEPPAEGCFLPLCDRVRALTALPICGVGGLTDPDFVEEQLRRGRADCVAMSRQLIADPDWPRKVQEGRTGEIRRCVRCNKACLGGMMAHRGVHCIYEKEESL